MRKLIATLIVLISVGQLNEAIAQFGGGGKSGIGPGSLPVVVYKTKKDYRNLVPVTLSDDKSKIVSYPDPKDFTSGSHNWLPGLLHKGYLLDNRGINKNVAYIKLTYNQYANLKRTPTIPELYAMIIDKDPLTEYWDCGQRKDYKDRVKKLNKLIDTKKIKTVCKSVK